MLAPPGIACGGVLHDSFTGYPLFLKYMDDHLELLFNKSLFARMTSRSSSLDQNPQTRWAHAIWRGTGCKIDMMCPIITDSICLITPWPPNSRIWPLRDWQKGLRSLSFEKHLNRYQPFSPKSKILLGDWSLVFSILKKWHDNLSSEDVFKLTFLEGLHRVHRGFNVVRPVS